MGITSKGNKMAMDTSETTVIAKGTKITGKIDIGCKLHVDGEIDGSIHSSNIVTIGTAGMIKGEVFAERLLVSGEIVGNCDCQNIEILAGGKILGDITSSNLVIESQGFFEGNSKIKVKEAPVASLTPKKAEK